MNWSPGWHPDPMGRFEFRYFNGQRWTSDVSVNGQRFVDQVEQAAAPFQSGPSRAFAIAAFWVGLGSFLSGWIPFVFALALAGAVAAFVFGVIALRRERQQPARGRGYAIAGIVLAVAALGTSAVGFVLTRAVMREVNSFLDVGPYEARVDRCVGAEGLISLDGFITNKDTQPHGYTVTVSYHSDRGVNDTEQVDVPTVGPGATAAFHSSTFADTSVPVECRIDAVNGPRPFAVP